jgi:hypothetical protein
MLALFFIVSFASLYESLTRYGLAHMYREPSHAPVPQLLIGIHRRFLARFATTEKGHLHDACQAAVAARIIRRNLSRPAEKVSPASAGTRRVRVRKRGGGSTTRLIDYNFVFLMESGTNL